MLLRYFRLFPSHPLLTLHWSQSWNSMDTMKGECYVLPLLMRFSRRLIEQQLIILITCSYSGWTIHDPSRVIVLANGSEMIAATGKDQARGYDCGIETHWRSAANGSSGNWRPGQCLFTTVSSFYCHEFLLSCQIYLVTYWFWFVYHSNIPQKPDWVAEGNCSEKGIARETTCFLHRGYIPYSTFILLMLLLLLHFLI